MQLDFFFFIERPNLNVCRLSLTFSLVFFSVCVHTCTQFLSTKPSTVETTYLAEKTEQPGVQWFTRIDNPHLIHTITHTHTHHLYSCPVTRVPLLMRWLKEKPVPVLWLYTHTQCSCEICLYETWIKSFSPQYSLIYKSLLFYTFK